MSEPDGSLDAAAPDPSSAIIVHFYRAVVGHMDVWRQRMDATTNWAAATTAAMVGFSFSAPDSPHFMLLLAVGFDTMFLLMESRRYQIFDLWRRRFRLLNRYVVAPALGSTGEVNRDAQAAALRGIGVELGRLVPHLSLVQAVGYRLRRNYGYVFSLVVVAWVLKLEVHPTAAPSLDVVVQRAAIGGHLPGFVVMILVLALCAVATTLALAAPTERMVDWSDLPSPLQRLVSRSPPGRE
jgi:uncharacterized membrane protein